MKKFIVVSTDKLTKKDQLKNQAVLLWKDEQSLEESNQFVLRISDLNSDTFRNFKKYSESQIIVARNNKLTLAEELPKKVISQPLPFSEKYLTTGEKLFKRIHGSEFVDIPPGESKIINVSIVYNWAKIEAMEIIGAGTSHKVNLNILDNEYNTYSGAPVNEVGSNFKLNQFAFGVNVNEKFYRFSSKYDADLYLGMVIQVEIFNNSNNPSQVGLNIELNEVK